MTVESTVRMVWPKAERPPRESARPVMVVDPEETFRGLREDSARLLRRSRGRVRVTTGLEALDELLGGGWTRGRVGELVGVWSSGGTGIAVATAAAATARGEVVAWIDGANAFDPASSAAAGMGLDRVLWARPRSFEEAVRAAELVLETGGFTVVVVDLVGMRGGGRARERERRGALRLRLVRAVERAGSVGVVLAGRPWVGTMAGTTLHLDRGRPLWGGDGSGPRWLDGLATEVRVERGSLGEVGRSVPMRLRHAPLPGTLIPEPRTGGGGCHQPPITSHQPRVEGGGRPCA